MLIPKYAFSNDTTHIYQSHEHYSVFRAEEGLGAGLSLYSSNTNRFLSNHGNTSFIFGVAYEDYHLRATFNAWSLKLDDSLVYLKDTISAGVEISPLRLGFEIEKDKDYRDFGFGIFTGSSILITTEEKIENRKAHSFPLIYGLIVGGDIYIPIYSSYEIHPEETIETRQATIRLRPSYTFVNQSKLYRKFGSNIIALSLIIEMTSRHHKKIIGDIL